MSNIHSIKNLTGTVIECLAVRGIMARGGETMFVFSLWYQNYFKTFQWRNERERSRVYLLK